MFNLKYACSTTLALNDITPNFFLNIFLLKILQDEKVIDCSAFFLSLPFYWDMLRAQ